MAKSLRSKWRRKCRAVKRVRYGKKEMDRLKKTLGITDTDSKDINMEELAQIANVVDPTSVPKAEDNPPETSNVNHMDVDSINKKFSTNTLRDKNGAYPVWLHPRKIMKKNKRTKTGKHNHNGKKKGIRKHKNNKI